MSTDMLKSLPKLQKNLLEFRAPLFKLYKLQTIEKIASKEIKELKITKNCFWWSEKMV